MLDILERDFLVSPAVGEDGIFGDLLACKLFQDVGCCVHEPHRSCCYLRAIEREGKLSFSKGMDKNEVST